MKLIEYVRENAVRGDCTCGLCIDAKDTPEQPKGHTADLIFFKVALAKDTASKETFLELIKKHTGEFTTVDVMDGGDHSYMELGAWLGDQSTALMFMGLGVLLGVFDLMSPVTMLGMKPDDPMCKEIVGRGWLSIRKTPEPVNPVLRDTASYTQEVKFTKTGQYGCGPEGEDDVYTISEFNEYCRSGSFVDYDGHGHPVKDRKSDPAIFIKPSRLEEIPKDATHIVWYNR